jgi:hypothetical protein
MKKLKTVLLIVFLGAITSTGFAQKAKKEKENNNSGYEFKGPYYEGLARVKNADKKWGFVDTTGNVVVKPKYNEVENFKDGLAKVRTGTKWGLVDNTGREVIKPTFEAIYEFINGKAQVLLNGEKYYMNREGQRVE